MRPLLLLPAVALLLLCGAPLAADAQLGPPHVDWFARDITEPLLQDAACNMETVETANSMQLHALLQELSETAFFRLINVNMETKCQYFGVKEEDEEPECTGGKSEPEEPGVEAVPLCSLGASEDSDPFGASAFGGMPPPVAPTVDHTITTTEDAALSSFQAQEEDCSNEELPTFWMDMCSNIATNASDYVNLQLNPERCAPRRPVPGRRPAS